MATLPPISPHARVLALVERTVGEWAANDRTMLAGAMPEHISDPIPLYRVDLDALKEAGDELPVHQQGWRTLLIAPVGGARAADVRGVDSELSFARLASGPGIDAMLAAAQEAEAAAAVDAKQEIRLIESDALKVAALWVHGEKSFVRPYLGLRPDHYSEGRFRAVLAERLKQIEAQYRPDEYGEPVGV
ncbi:MAG TPA: hypothetical protein VFW35_08010 [Sphingomicrobium sp.]|nr:hypothetical protein [Sphingomicrobium sp.]